MKAWGRTVEDQHDRSQDMVPQCLDPREVLSSTVHRTAHPEFEQANLLLCLEDGRNIYSTAMRFRELIEAWHETRIGGRLP